jgi:hypothetical protein
MQRKSEQETEGKPKPGTNRGCRGEQRKIPQSGTKAVLCRRFTLMSADFKSETKN